MTDAVRSKKVFFISECLINQNIRAYGVGNMKGEGAVKEVIDLLMNYGYGLTVVPCPEIDYEGLRRTACGKERYDNPVYRELCRSSAEKVIERYRFYCDDGYKIGGFICVNGSPSCGIDFCHRDGKRCDEQGVFIEEFLVIAAREKVTMPILGFRAKELNTLLSRLRLLCEEK